MSSIYIREQNVTDKAHIAYTITDEGMDGFGRKKLYWVWIMADTRQVMKGWMALDEKTILGLDYGGHSASNTVFDLSDMRHSCCY